MPDGPSAPETGPKESPAAAPKAEMKERPEGKPNEPHRETGAEVPQATQVQVDEAMQRLGGGKVEGTHYYRGGKDVEPPESRGGRVTQAVEGARGFLRRLHEEEAGQLGLPGYEAGPPMTPEEYLERDPRAREYVRMRGQDLALEFREALRRSNGDIRVSLAPLRRITAEMQKTYKFYDTYALKPFEEEMWRQQRSFDEVFLRERRPRTLEEEDIRRTYEDELQLLVDMQSLLVMWKFKARPNLGDAPTIAKLFIDGDYTMHENDFWIRIFERRAARRWEKPQGLKVEEGLKWDVLFAYKNTVIERYTDAEYLEKARRVIQEAERYGFNYQNFDEFEDVPEDERTAETLAKKWREMDDNTGNSKRPQPEGEKFFKDRLDQTRRTNFWYRLRLGRRDGTWIPEDKILLDEVLKESPYVSPPDERILHDVIRGWKRSKIEALPFELPDEAYLALGLPLERIRELKKIRIKPEGEEPDEERGELEKLAAAIEALTAQLQGKRPKFEEREVKLDVDPEVLARIRERAIARGKQLVKELRLTERMPEDLQTVESYEAEEASWFITLMSATNNMYAGRWETMENGVYVDRRKDPQFLDGYPSSDLIKLTHPDIRRVYKMLQQEGHGPENTVEDTPSWLVTGWFHYMHFGWFENADGTREYFPLGEVEKKLKERLEQQYPNPENRPDLEKELENFKNFGSAMEIMIEHGTRFPDLLRTAGPFAWRRFMLAVYFAARGDLEGLHNMMYYEEWKAEEMGDPETTRNAVRAVDLVFAYHNETGGNGARWRREREAQELPSGFKALKEVSSVVGKAEKFAKMLEKGAVRSKDEKIPAVSDDWEKKAGAQNQWIVKRVDRVLKAKKK